MYKYMNYECDIMMSHKSQIYNLHECIVNKYYVTLKVKVES